KLTRVVVLAGKFSFDDSGTHTDRAILTFGLKHQLAVFPRAFDSRLTELRTAAARYGFALNFQCQQEWKRLSVCVSYSVPLSAEIESTSRSSGSSRRGFGCRCYLLEFEWNLLRSITRFALDRIAINFSHERVIFGVEDKCERSILKLSVCYRDGL